MLPFLLPVPCRGNLGKERCECRKRKQRKIKQIMDMGITKGTEIYIRKVAPLGDPIEVTVRGYELSLRKADAEMIEIG